MPISNLLKALLAALTVIALPQPAEAQYRGDFSTIEVGPGGIKCKAGATCDASGLSVGGAPLSSALKREGGKTVITPDTLQILGLGSTGDVSTTSVKAPGAPSGQTLTKWMTTPSFVSTTSPLDTDAYASGRKTGEAAFMVRSSDGRSQVGVAPADQMERYAGYFIYDGPGTGIPDVPGSAFGLQVSNTKQNWFNSSVPGQTIGQQIVTRGGYHGPLMTSAPGEFGGYYPGGDVTAQIINTVQSSYYAQNAAGEYAIHFADGGRFDGSGDVHTMNVQLGAMKMRNPDGSTANPGIGVAVSAARGTLNYAFQANNTARPGSYSIRPGIWSGFLRYNLDDGGTRAPFDAFRVDQDGSIHMSSGGAVTPTKKLRASAGGTFEVLNHAGTPILDLSDAGVLRIGSGGNQRVVQTEQGVWTAYNGALQFDSGSTASGTYTARYEVTGKRLSVSGSFAISAIGGDPKFGIYVPLPAGTAVASVCPGVGNEFAVTGKMLNVRGQGAATRLTITNYDNTSAAVASAQGMFSVACEIQ